MSRPFNNKGIRHGKSEKTPSLRGAEPRGNPGSFDAAAKMPEILLGLRDVANGFRFLIPGVTESLPQVAEVAFAKNRARQPFHDLDEQFPGKKDQQQEEKHAQDPSNGRAQRIGHPRSEKNQQLIHALE
ncbi:MAG: hypothetical protein LBQ62_05040 [Candidatus Accumulibacter sp.]|jgi:hypothetical protein|nr:hypothetical protein [Accumulibacter sp.]